MLMCYVLKMFSVYCVILLGGEHMNMRNEFESLFTHWDFMSDTEFESLLAECGVERIQHLYLIRILIVKRHLFY